MVTLTLRINTRKKIKIKSENKRARLYEVKYQGLEVYSLDKEGNRGRGRNKRKMKKNGRCKEK